MREVSSSPPLRITLLGPLELWRGQQSLVLPQSKKTRALLAYLLRTARAHRRDRLTALLWDVVDDPKAALRWSLSKLRRLVDESGVERIVTTREAIAFELRGASSDIGELTQALDSRHAALSTERIEELVGLFRGPFLEGLDLPDHGDFQAWLVAEREHWRGVRLSLLRELVARRAGRPEAALGPARQLVALDPTNEAARATLVRHLFHAGHREEAQQHVQLGAREMEALGLRPTGELQGTWRSLQAPPASATAEPAAAARPRQKIRVCTARDGARIAYATSGEGPALVKAGNWLTHLDYDDKSPLWRHLARDLGRGRQLVRYDQRGNGLSDWNAELSFEALVGDLETVVEAAGVQRFALLGISQGSRVAIAYAARHPERLTHLVLYGGAARGWRLRGEEVANHHAAISTLMRRGWGSDNPAFHAYFANLFMPGASSEQMAWLTELQGVSCSAETAIRTTALSAQVDVRELLDSVRTPTLVLHATRDAVVPFGESRVLAAGIPDARLVALDSPNHLLLGEEPAWPRFVAEVQAFLAEAPGRTPAR